MHNWSRRSNRWLAMHSGRITMEPTVGCVIPRRPWTGPTDSPLMQPMCISWEGCHPRRSMCIITTESTVAWYPRRLELARLARLARL
jgi:hypothetical protein